MWVSAAKVGPFLGAEKGKKLKFCTAEKAVFEDFYLKIQAEFPEKQAFGTRKQKQNFSFVFLVFCLAITIP